jgi:solute carrier family 35 protein F1/2
MISSDHEYSSWINFEQNHVSLSLSLSLFQHVSRVEYVGMIGLFGMMWCLIIIPIFEWDAVVDLFTDTQHFLPAIAVILWYISSLVGYYIFESLFLQKSDATLLNLSLQTSNFWAIMFSVIVFHEKPERQFYLAVSLVTGGVVCYELCGNTSTSNGDGENTRQNSTSANSHRDYESIIETSK